MSTVYLLDSGPLGMICYPKGHAEGTTCSQWFDGMLQRGAVFVVPEIVDYETRRAFLRTRNTNAIAKLDILKAGLGYLPLTTAMMLQAAAFWADVRQRGLTTAADDALDGDVILAAQAATLAAQTGDTVRIATGNVRHLAAIVPAEDWRTIR